MNNVIRNVLFGGLLWLAVPLSAQVPQDLIDKAKAAGMTDDQIRQEMNKRMGQSGAEQTARTASDAVVTDRTVTVQDGKVIPPLDAQREANRPAGDLSGTVFGREIFSNKNLSFEPDLNVPTPKGYVLSAGDELLINVWGDSELNLKLKVSPEGTILIPNLGPVSVSGLTIETAENRIRQELGRIMSTLSGNTESGSTDGANTFVSVSLSQIRSIKVNIVGEVVAPGTYTLPSFATLFNALYAAGGVNEIGSLRGIKVYRNSKEVAKLDVYDYLLNGKYNTNIRLEENDMVLLKIDNFEQLNASFFTNCEKNYHPAQVVIEYNGMWKLEDLLSIRYPRSFELQGVYSTVNGTTLDMYLMNMRNMLMEQLTESELIVVNRCADGVNRSGFRRALKVQNPMAQLIFEDMQGKIIEPSEEDLPYDVKGDKIVLDDVDFGVWYVDAYDHPELYLHKEIDFKGQIFRPKGMPDNMFVPVREIMTCCADDVRYYGYPCKAEKKIDVKAKSWMQIRARFEYEAVSSFGNKQPVLYLIDMEPAAEPEDKVVYLG